MMCLGVVLLKLPMHETGGGGHGASTLLSCPGWEERQRETIATLHILSAFPDLLPQSGGLQHLPASHNRESLLPS